MSPAPALDAALYAIADPTRRRIVERLMHGPARVTDLAAPFSMSLNGVSKHLKVLEEAGLVSKGRDGQHRPCRAEVATLDPAIAWLDERREQWEDRLDRLGDHLRRIQRVEPTTTRKKDS